MNLSQRVGIATGMRPLSHAARLPFGARSKSILSAIIFGLASLVGIVAFVSPFFLPQVAQNTVAWVGKPNRRCF